MPIETHYISHDIITNGSVLALKISISKAQRLYNYKVWPNPIVVKLTNVEFVK